MMASPNAFLPSPSRSARQTSHFFRSSSPDLPVIGDILSPGVRIRPPRYGDKTLVISSDEEPAIKDGDGKKRSKTLAAGPTPSVSNRSGTAEDGDSSLCIIDPPITHTPVAQRNHAAPPPRFTAHSSSPTKDQPWKKFKSKTDNIQGDSPEVQETPLEDIRTISSPRPASDLPPVVEPNSKRVGNDINEPLRLEPAMIRRLDWTPPSNKTLAIHELQSSAIKDTHSPELQEADQSFEQILEAYKCTHSLQQEVSTPSGEGANVLGKRKLLELVVTTAAPAAPAAGSAEAKNRSPVKQKAPRKRPRTITELAISAYRVPDPLEPVPVAMDDSTITITHKDSDDPATIEESKRKTKRKTTKATAKKKKKPSPPSPTLLPPAEALQAVARQDFVFGTSSQLAIENSPTFLRDLQAAMRRSNRVDYVDLDSPLNSDGIEPPEQKRLWAAGARDIDGDLFNLEINKIMERSSQPLPAPYDDDDPFGYIDGDKKTTLLVTNGVGAHAGLPSSPLIISNEVLSNGAKPIEMINDDSVLADGEVSVESPLKKVLRPADGTQSSKTHELHDTNNSNQVQYQSSKPSFELFTDAQLSKEIASYGFKTIKSRQAKISLLEQCWQSKSSIQQPNSTRTFTTSLATGNSALDNNIQTPRGRPRKNSSSSTPEIQEPPPSAQPPVSPSKPRGRPKKNLTTAKRTTASPSKEKKASPKASTETSTTQKRKPKAPKVTVEIPDSASDNEHSPSPDSTSSPGLPFSQPRVDLSTSVMDDTDLNLSGDQSLGYEYITKAVQSAPRTTDPKNPSWHEKILLYDPIVLEDFTTWLNCGQLTRVGFDGEVSTMEVKQWCESKSICCLWKVNLRGKERKRY